MAVVSLEANHTSNRVVAPLRRADHRIMLKIKSRSTKWKQPRG